MDNSEDRILFIIHWNYQRKNDKNTSSGFRGVMQTEVLQDEIRENSIPLLQSK